MADEARRGVGIHGRVYRSVAGVGSPDSILGSRCSDLFADGDPMKVERTERDGAMSVQRIGDSIWIDVTSDGFAAQVGMSEYNANRVFASLAAVLGIELPKRILENL